MQTPATGTDSTSPRNEGRLARSLESAWLALALGFVGALATAWVWGGVNAPPVVSDEAAYVLQARIFSGWHWTGPARPLPEFFEQAHVISSPALVPKYPPGHALLLTPGVWLGTPGLVPLVLVGITGALLFVSARRLSNPGAALLAWALWLGAPGSLRWRATYFSEGTTAVCWLLGWWALLRWRDKGRERWLWVLSACAAWSLVTRPLSAVVFALPVAVVVSMDIVRRRAWWVLRAPAVSGLAVVALSLVWNVQTTGDWTTSPYRLYQQRYLPAERLGFGAPQLRTGEGLPPDIQRAFLDWEDVHRGHELTRLPATLTQRVYQISRDVWGGWRAVTLGFFLFGCTILGGAGFLALGTVGLLIAAMLSYGHPPGWTLYYYEAQTVLFFVTALGLGRFADLTARQMQSRPVPNQAPGRRTWRPALALVISATVITLSLPEMSMAGRTVSHWRRHLQMLFALTTTIPAAKAIVFIRYGPAHSPHSPLVSNGPDLSTERIWFVYDRGPENRKLHLLAPDRIPYIFDEAAGSLTPLVFESQTIGLR